MNYFSIFFERFNAFQDLWGLYATVGVGFVAFLAAIPKASESIILRRVLTATFLVFAMSNLLALNNVRSQRENIASMIEESVGEQRGQLGEYEANLIASCSPSHWILLFLFHLAFDAAIVWLIWWLPKLRTGAVSQSTS